MFVNKKLLDILDNYLIPDLCDIVLKYLECPVHKREHQYYEHLMCTYQLPLFEFPKSICGNIYLVLGRRRSGKTSFIRDGVSHIKQCKSLAMTLGKHNIHNVDTQIYNYKMSYLRPFLLDHSDKVVILDDCFTTSLNMEFRNLFVNGRDYLTDYFISFCYPGVISPYFLRNNVDYLVVFKDDYVMTKKKIFENYVSDFFMNYGHFDLVMNSLNSFEALIFDLQSEIIYFYKIKN